MVHNSFPEVLMLFSNSGKKPQHLQATTNNSGWYSVSHIAV